MPTFGQIRLLLLGCQENPRSPEDDSTRNENVSSLPIKRRETDELVAVISPSLFAFARIREAQRVFPETEYRHL